MLVMLATKGPKTLCPTFVTVRLGFHICGLSVGVLLLLSGGGFTSPRRLQGSAGSPLFFIFKVKTARTSKHQMAWDPNRHTARFRAEVCESCPAQVCTSMFASALRMLLYANCPAQILCASALHKLLSASALRKCSVPVLCVCLQRALLHLVTVRKSLRKNLCASAARKLLCQVCKSISSGAPCKFLCASCECRASRATFVRNSCQCRGNALRVLLMYSKVGAAGMRFVY